MLLFRLDEQHKVRNDVFFAALDYLFWLISAINDEKGIANNTDLFDSLLVKEGKLPQY
jgi:hypothetical protein